MIPLDGRPFTSERIRGYLGEARARWEGDTLVVEAKHFSDKANCRRSAETLRIVERFTRTVEGLRYSVTIDDPKTCSRSWTAALNLAPAVDVFEYGCHEGNDAMRNMLSGARKAEQAAAK